MKCNDSFAVVPPRSGPHPVSQQVAKSPGREDLYSACLRRLRLLGIGSSQSIRMAGDECAAARTRSAQYLSADDQRVFPHPRGWLVTKAFDAGGARLFEKRGDAERHARRVARDHARERSGSGILFYNENGCVLLHVTYPGWRR